MDEIEVSDMCCSVWPRILGAFNWCYFQDNPEYLVIPCIKKIGSEGNFDSWSINHCPSCGKEIGNTMISQEMLDMARAELLPLVKS